MRAASLPSFRPSPYAVRAIVLVLPVLVALIVLLAFAATGAAASAPGQNFDEIHPFRWG